MNKLSYMIGPSFWREKYGGWYFQLGLYWFALTFFKRWDPNTRYTDGRPCPWTGFVIYYKPNPVLEEGDLIWLKCKKWMWPDYPKVT